MLQSFPRCLTLLLLALVFLSPPARAQDSQSVASLLKWQDALVLAHYQADYRADHRYDAILARVSRHLNAHLAQVYPHYKPVYYYVFFARMGFNAQTWDHVIIFDSLLFDVLHHLCECIARHGTTQCASVRRLAACTVRESRLSSAAITRVDAGHPRNPYHLPTIHGLTPAEESRSDRLFEEMIAAWVAHEASHAFLDHCRQRLVAQAERTQELTRRYGDNPVPRAVLDRYVNSYLSYDLGLRKEREADAYGVRLLVRSGYPIEGFIDSLKFAAMLESDSGVAREKRRTHPTPQERIRLAREVASRELARMLR